MADTEGVGWSLSSTMHTGAGSVHWKGNNMDLSQILASQSVGKNAWIGNEDAFYDRHSLEGLAKFRSTLGTLKRSLMHTVRLAQRASRKRMQHNLRREFAESRNVLNTK